MLPSREEFGKPWAESHVWREEEQFSLKRRKLAGHLINCPQTCWRTAVLKRVRSCSVGCRRHIWNNGRYYRAEDRLSIWKSFIIKLECTAVGRGSFLDLRILAEAAWPPVEEISALNGADSVTSSVFSNGESMKKPGCFIALTLHCYWFSSCFTL